MAGADNLIPHRIKTTEKARRLGRLGGLARTPAKKYAAQIREMKKRGLKSDDIEFFFQRIIDPEANMVHMEKYLEIAKDNMTEKDYLTLCNQLHRNRFGDKVQIKSINVNVDVQLKSDETEDLLELLKENGN